MKMKKLIAGFLAAALCLTLAACGGGSPQTDPGTAPRQEPAAPSQSEEKDTLVVRAHKDIGDLNPHTMKSQMYAQDWVYESLVALENDQIVPVLAESWEISPDGCTYTFHLREGVKFSDGSDFTSAVAKRNIEAVQRHADGYSFLQSLTSITGIDTPDDLTLVLRLSQPASSRIWLALSGS